MHKYIYRKINYNFQLNKRPASHGQGGLTLIELMVVISIFLVITGVLIFDYGSFRSTVSLQNLTDDIALSIRKAQSFAIGARGVGNEFNKSYGVHFSTNASVSSLAASSKSFLMFSAIMPSKRYELGTGLCGNVSSNKCMELFTIMTFDSVKTIILDGDEKPASSYLDIVFTRPDPRAYFCYRTSVSGECSGNYSRASIVISNNQIGAKLKTKTISIQNTGQISIE